MHVDPLERLWVSVVGVLVALMLGSILYSVFAFNVHPPSNVESIDSTRLHLTEEFSENNLGLQVGEDGSITVRLVAHRYGFFPAQVEIPAGKPVTFRIATPDVLHGLHIPGTNVDTMVIPGYVSELRTVIDYDSVAKYGRVSTNGNVTLPLYCNEYCGLGHHSMWSRVTVLPEA